MSEISRNLLHSTHQGVHEQLDVAIAAINAYEKLYFDPQRPLAGAIRSHHKKIIKSVIKEFLLKLDQKPGFIKVGLTFYAYEFWESIVERRFGRGASQDDVARFSQTVIEELASYLDAQFESEGRADTIGFLKSF